MREVDEVTGEIVDAALFVHTRLGPGLLESVYEAVLASTLERRGLQVERQKSLVFDVDGVSFDEGLRVDLLVEGSVVVYLRLLCLPVGLLINFGAPTLKEGLRRIVNHYQSPPSAAPRLRVRLTQRSFHMYPFMHA